MKTYQEIREHIVSLLDAGKGTEAAPILEMLIERNPNDAWALASLGSLFSEWHRNGLGIPLLVRALDIVPDSAEVWSNLGAALRQAGHNDEARHALEQSVKINPAQASAYCNISGTYVNNGTPEEAEKWARKALEINPLHAQSGNHLGLALLEQGKWDEAWKAWEARFSLPSYEPRSVDAPRWQGEHVGTLAVTGEQGIGDEIMFLSMLPDAMARADRVIVECQPRLQPVVERSFGVETVGKADELPPVDAQIPMGSLGGLFRLKDSDFPRTPYLQPDPERVEYWRGRLHDLFGDAPYIGIAWKGGIKQTHKQLRCTSLSEWRPILNVRGCGFVSVQYGDVGHEAKAQGVMHWPEANEREHFEEQMALIAACDLVITVQQTAAHIAGAIGKEAWVMVPSKPRWAYGIKGSRMPWYGSPYLYRQKGEHWRDTIDRIARDLRRYQRRVSGAKQAAA